MAGEFSSILKKRYFKPKVSQQVLKDVGVRNDLLKLLDTYLKEPGDILTFEVEEDYLSPVIEAISHDVVTSRFEIMQIEATVFRARLQVLEDVLGW